MTKVKICGITNIIDALGAVEAGADAIGLNFYRASPRFITAETAADITSQLPERVLKVGVFVNESLENIQKYARIAGLTAVQLHGDESEDFVREVRAASRLPVIKAFRVSNGFDPGSLRTSRADSVLLDSFSTTDRGGTGETFDWSIAADIGRNVPKLYLAGGLTLENVTVAVEVVRPYAVDVCSGVESAKGLKDRAKMRLFIERVKRI